MLLPIPAQERRRRRSASLPRDRQRGRRRLANKKVRRRARAGELSVAEGSQFHATAVLITFNNAGKFQSHVHRVSKARPAQADYGPKLRRREYFAEADIERLMDAAKGNRWVLGGTMALVAYRHGLRSSELVGLRGDQIDFETASLHVRRAKKGTPSTHPILGDELPCGGSSANRSPNRRSCSRRSVARHSRPQGFTRMVEGAGSEAKLGFKAHPHMLRHACGYALANRGHDTRAPQAYLGHKNIQHTVRYTEMSPMRFKNFWRE
jgi:integrase